MKRGLILLAGWLALSAAWAQDEDRSTIRAIEVRNTGPGQVDESYIMAHTSMRPGQALDRARMARDVRALLDTGGFTSVQVDIEARKEGVAVIFVVERKLLLAAPVIFTGSTHLRRSKLQSLLDLDVGDRVDDQVLGFRTRAIRDEFRSDHYPDAVVSWEIEETDHAQGLARVLVHIESGPRSKVKTVRFEGNTHIANGDLRQAIRRPPAWSPMWLFRKRRYTSDELEAMRVAVRSLYRSRGYLDAGVEYPAIELDDKGRQVIVVKVHEGNAYRFGDVSLEGIALFPQAEIEQLVSARPGETASSTQIEATVNAIRDFYGSRGYARVRVRPLLESDREAGTMKLVLDVTEGPLIRIGNIDIRGNTRTRDKVIRRELLIYPGDVLDAVKARRSERRLQNLGYFDAVRRYEQKTSVPNREDVVFEVEEKRTGQFLVGAGFSSVDNIIGFVEVSQGNFDIGGWPRFTGGGQKLNLRAQFGSERKDYKLSFVEPWFLNRKLALGLDFYRTDLNYSDYDLEQLGAAVSVSKALPGANRITFRYALEKTKITDIADTNEYRYADSPGESYFFAREEDTLKSSLRTSLSHDTRNNPFVPTRGMRASVFAEVSGGPLGFDTDIYGLGANGAVYVPLWWDHVLSMKGRYEIVDAYDGTDEVPINDRLFAGGGRTIRGFGYRDVGPKVVPADPSSSIDYRPVGGQSLAVANIEYTIPLVKSIRLAAFYDVGGVWRDPYAFDADRLASGAGVGLRFDLPGFPIRIDRAWPVKADDDLTDTDEWVIWIGYDY